MSPHIFPIDWYLATFMRILAENWPTCSASYSRTADGILPLTASCFPAFWEDWFGFQVPAASRGAWSTFSLWEVTQGLQGDESIIFKDWLRQSECTREVMQSHFKQGCPDSNCTMPPADFNRCPTSFKRNHYQHSTAPVAATLLFQSASLSRCCPSCVGIARCYQPVNETLCTDSTDQALFPWCTLWRAFLLQLPLRKTEPNLLPYKNCMFLWKSKCKLFINFVTMSKGREK